MGVGLPGRAWPGAAFLVLAAIGIVALASLADSMLRRLVSRPHQRSARMPMVIIAGHVEVDAVPRTVGEVRPPFG